MDYQNTALNQPAKDIAREVIQSKESQLLVPPKLQNQPYSIPELEAGEKQVGLFSSGTTGNPKVIWNTFTNLKKNAVRTAQAFQVTPNSRLLMLAAPWHVAGLSWAIMAEEIGCDYEFITTRKGEGSHWLQAVQDFKADYVMTVPAVLKALYGKDWFVPNVVFGGYSMEQDLLKKLKAHCDVTIQGYGQTEAGGLIAAHRLRSKSELPDYGHLCCGKPIEGVKVSCDGSPENPAPIFIKSDTAYTSEKYNSGDLGFLDRDGNVHVLGRANTVVQKK